MAEVAKINLPACITTSQLSKSFGSQSVFNACEFTFSTNDRSLLLGANGSGKSTLLGLIAGNLAPTAGKISIPNRLKLAYLSQDLQLFRYLTVQENLELFAKLGEHTQSLEQELSYWQLTPLKNQLINNLSRGWQQRVNLCRLFLQTTSFLLLDEPSTHLDLKGVELFKQRIELALEAKQISGFILATHDLHNLFELVNSVYVLNDGQLRHFPEIELSSALNHYQEINR